MTPADWRSLAARQFVLLHDDLARLLAGGDGNWLHADASKSRPHADASKSRLLPGGDEGRLPAGEDGGRPHAVPDVPSGTPTPAWLAWHVARGQDRNISEILGRAQLWTAHGWAARFGRLPDPADTGLGHTAGEAAAFRVPHPAAGTLTAYLAAAHALTLEYLAAAPPDDTDRSVTSPTLGNTHTVQDRLAALLRDGFEHAGQLSVLPPPEG